MKGLNYNPGFVMTFLTLPNASYMIISFGLTIMNEWIQHTKHIGGMIKARIYIKQTPII
jgi:hypothetical protein